MEPAAIIEMQELETNVVVACQHRLPPREDAKGKYCPICHEPFPYREQRTVRVGMTIQTDDCGKPVRLDLN